ncbi:MAG TPA: MBL fold metallo-hydrolase [Anaerolineae bacterium]|nr:MBL fold metallo-hydrolase [Anaerolineae bacterium]
MRLTYVRWSMTIVEAGDVTIVTDPVFRMMGVPQAPRSFTFDRLPRPDLVFISHTHVDHFEPATLRKLDPETPVWMPAEKVEKAQRLGLRALRGLEAWETDMFRGVRLTAVPAKHTGGELGLVVEADRTVYFAGDTSLDRELFREIGNRWRLDAVLLPIGDLRSLGVPYGHIGPRKAAQALRLLGEPQVVVPTHYSGMTLGPLMHFGGTPRKLGRALEKAGVGTTIGAGRPLQVAEV